MTDALFDEKLLIEAGIGQLEGVSVNKDDLIAILVAKKERDLLDRRTELEVALPQQELAITDKAKAFQTHCREKLFSDYKTALMGVVSQLQQLGFGEQLNCSVEISEKCPSQRNDDYYTEDRAPKGEVPPDMVRCRMTLSGRGHAFVSCYRLISLDAHGITLQRDLISAKELKTSIEQELITVRKTLSQLTTMERQAKAAIATRLLANSKVGQNILTLLESTQRALPAKL